MGFCRPRRIGSEGKGSVVWNLSLGIFVEHLAGNNDEEKRVGDFVSLFVSFGFLFLLHLGEFFSKLFSGPVAGLRGRGA